MHDTAENVFLRVRDLRKTFRIAHGIVTALNGVSFDVEHGGTTAIVGESGCGKSTLALCLLGLIESDGGKVTLNGEDQSMDMASMQKRLGRDFGIVFQNPYSALDPKMRVRQIVAEPLQAIERLRGGKLRDRVLRSLADVGLGEQHLDRFPHEFSGGQRQRIAIARALAVHPRLLILDEPTAALDVSVQAQVLTLLKALQERTGIGYIFITHDLGTVEYFADHIVVMYLGNVVESGPVAEIFASPHHPYTRALLDSVPTIDFDTWGQLKTLKGEIPSAVNRPTGCAFAPRCVYSSDTCTASEPAPESAHTGRSVACFHPLGTASTEAAP